MDEFAKTRGFTGAELHEYGISINEDGTIRIPILGRRGPAHPWGYRIHRPNGKPKYQNEVEGLGHHLYNPLGLGPHSEEVWIAEGEFDTLSLVTVGAPAVGILGASGFRRSWALLFQGAEIVIALDPDAESEEQRKRVGALTGMFEASKTSRFDPLNVGGYMDINEWFKVDREDLARSVESW